MKIAVCLKRVPDTATKVRVGADGKAIDPTDVQYIISPYDEFAVEEAIATREKAGAGTVTAVCLGPEAAQQNVRHALAMGADSGVLVKYDGPALDPYQVAKTLAATIGSDNDMVWFGRQAVDDGFGQVGPMTAQLLGIPCVTEVVAFELDGQTAKVTREIEGAQEKIEVSLPAAFTAQKGLNEPRYASLKGIMAAKKKPIDMREFESVEGRLQQTGLELPPERSEGRIVGEGVEAVSELVRVLKEEAKAI